MSAHIKTAMSRYENILQEACADVENSCACCGEFVSNTASEQLPVDHPHLQLTWHSDDTTLLLDKCSLRNGFYSFCRQCFRRINDTAIPKFSSLNGANVTACQHYPSELEDLTLIEESVIARCLPIGIVLKLSPNGVRNSQAYNAIRGHLITIPQNPGPLLDILPSPDLQFQDHIRIIWSGKAEPTMGDLKDFAEIRKSKVLHALLWLCEHNPLYSSVQINYELINRWSDNFVPPVIQKNIISLSADSDSAERGTYAEDMDLVAENDLQTALGDMGDNEIGSGAVYSDVEGQRLNPELKMIAALTEMLHSSDNRTTPNSTEIPVIQWTSEKKPILLNDYDDAAFFTGAFPTLFPYGNGGHKVDSSLRPIPISLEAWAKWLLNHHSRRLVKF